MKCQECGEREAVYHLTEVVSNEMTVTHLCESCAAARGLDTAPEADSPLSDLIAHVTGAEGADPGPRQSDRCDFCGLTYKDFKELGRLGCPQCWSTFEVPLRALLRRVHGATQHIGKVYLPPDPTASEMQKRLEGLRNRLDRAVEAEDFERAAKLRDEIRTLELKG